MLFNKKLMAKNAGKRLLEVNKNEKLGPVVQSIVSLTSYLVVKILTVLVTTISNSQVFLLRKM